MEPVKTADCNILYKGTNEQIGDLWVHRIRPGEVRATYQLSEEELEVLKSGGRIQLYMLREPISAVRLVAVTKEESEPIAPHGFKVDKMPGDKLEEKEEAHGDEDQDTESVSKERTPQQEEAPTSLGEAADTVSA